MAVTRAAKSGDELKARAGRILRKLAKRHPDVKCALTHDDAWQLLVATILSAQCTDERVNKVTPVLFAKYPDPASLARAKQADVEKIIHSTGFYRNKAKSLVECAKGVTERFGAVVPHTMEELVTLRGVARKTANVVLGNAYGINEGVVVDTHVLRLTKRMGWTRETDPVKVERDLMALFPRKKWADLAHLLIWHGRRVCGARKPECGDCPVRSECPKVGVKS